MHLYNFTVHKPTAVTQAIQGSFSGPKQNEILVAKGRLLELFRQDPETRRLVSAYQEDCFGLIRTIQPLRLEGSNTDYVIIGSDSGRIVVVSFDSQKNRFVKVHQETFGKSGCRRIVPGQYLAVDSRGRAAMIGAIEKQKFVYVFNRDSANQLTISSPLEAHQSHTVVYDMVNVDVGFENPVFACLELSHADTDHSDEEDIYAVTKKMLTFYEFDLSLNNVIIKERLEVDNTSHHLISVPGGTDGPSGVLVCSENFITYRNIGESDEEVLRVPIPRRKDMPADRGLMIVASAMMKRRKVFFYLIQSECGDLYKVTLATGDGSEVLDIDVRYFDTVPVANSLCIMRSGHLYVASEFSDTRLYQILQIDDDDTPLEETAIEVSPGNFVNVPVFEPRPLKNLMIYQENQSLAPITDMKVVDLLEEGTPQFYCLCGRGPQSSLRMLKHGLSVAELAVSPLNGTPIAVWTVKQNIQDPFDKYIVISFSNLTMVLSIGENVQQVYDSGFLGTVPTIYAGNIGEESLLQVHSNGVHMTHPLREEPFVWSRDKKQVVHAAANESQLVVALSGGELVYFEYDNMSHELIEIEAKDMGMDIACLAIGPVPEQRQRSRYLAVGCFDRTVRVFSLDPEDCMSILTRQALPAEPSALSIAELPSAFGMEQASLYLYIGLNNGVLLRNVLDSLSGELSDTRTRFLGSRPVKLMKVRVTGHSMGVIALSSRPWLMYDFQGKLTTSPLSYMALEYVSSFSSEQCPEGFVSITSQELRVLMLESLGQTLSQTVFPLKYTPRKFVVQPDTQNIVILETDHNAYTQTEKVQMRQQREHVDAMDTLEDGAEEKLPVLKAEQLLGEVNEEMPEREYGAPKTSPNSGKWASYIRIFNVQNGHTLDFLELDNNEAAFSLACCRFDSAGTDDMYLVVGTAKDMRLFPRSCPQGFIRVYKFVQRGSRLEFVHKTAVEDVPYAIHAFQGRVLVGVKNVLRLYDLGKKRMLRKCENKTFPNNIVSIRSQGSRIYVGDITESFHFVKYKRQENILAIFADDLSPRWVVSSTVLDYDTVAGGDKFGNFYVCRLPDDVSEDVEDDFSANRWMWERGVMGGAPQKAQEIVQFHVGEVVTSLCKASLIPGGPSVLAYSTVMGTIGLLIPFATREDIEYFMQLEMQMRQHNPPLAGNDHLAFRSFYYPVRNVVDGDFLQQFHEMDLDKQRAVADALERPIHEVAKKLEDIVSMAGGL